ncbi:MAG TPA: chromosome segregation protein SMC [Nitrospirota bacterium]|nr:chromosome segregation protein SMC [Nitrospirota bacterium]
MQLKTLEMIGFKSFCDKTVVTFQPGVTAVVGPNGCGKSNISDAIRWVLGEQSAKHLRGDKMEDVIFNGSENRKPLGMAEVTLRLTNAGGNLPSDFGHYEEIEITRRLYRSGESEYLINKIPCRLKDIRDLMMDAGVGAKIHAIIEQDKVDQILSSKPQDRRFLFEEVAGVMKYKARRQEALSKLESTQQNQLRVNDIIIEVKRQLNSLDRQAKKAERYQKLRAEMKDLEFRLASVEYSNLGIEWTATTDEFRQAENNVIQLHADLSRIEASIEESRADALAAEHELSVLRNKIHETESALNRAEHRVEMSRSQIAALMEQRGRDLLDVEYLKQEAVRTTVQKAQAEEELHSLASSISEKNDVLAGRNDVLDVLTRELREKELSVDESRTGILNAMTATADEKSKISNLQTRMSQLDEQDARSLREKQDLERKIDELKTHIAQKERELDDILARKQAAENERTRLSDSIEQAAIRKKSVETALNETKNRLAAQNSRLQSLIELEQSLEGYQKGVRTVMSARKEAESSERLGTIHGIVADMIETEPKYETAIEAVLGERLQYVVVDSQNDSLKAIEYLKTKSGGRSTFIPKAPREVKTAPYVKNGHAGVIGSALSIIRCHERYQNVASYLLGDVVVVDSLDTALYLWNKDGFDKTVVTLSGEILDRGGAVTGGTVEAVGAGMLTKRREIKDLEHETAALTVGVAKAEAEFSAVEVELERDRKNESGLADLIHAAELEFVNKEKERHGISAELSRDESRINELDHEIAGRAVSRTELNDLISRSTEVLHGLEAGHADAQLNLETLQAALSAQRESLETARTAITEIKMELTALQEKQAAASRNREVYAQAENDLADRLSTREQEIATIAIKLGESEAAIAEAEREIKSYLEMLNGEKQILVTKQEAHSVKNQALHSQEEQARSIRHEIEAAQKQLTACEVKRTELRLKIEHLKDRIWTGYHAELETVVQELGQFEIDLEGASERLNDLREKIDQMGPINVDALQEYNELKERYDLLSAQQNDINESINNLKATISKLDGETIELFTEAFNSIQEKFKEVFSLLFEGGKAELVLLDPANILESGIEIIAQPRGKKFQSITLLSGGERALTAIALLFAAFLVKPSPFCMLDEVDAPLDEANVTRFTRLIREMSTRSQFITITHNKRTMEMADALYGITMEEPGCSRIISARLKEATAAAVA